MSPSSAEQASRTTTPRPGPWTAGAWGADTISAQQLKAVGADVSGENLEKLMTLENKNDDQGANGLLAGLTDPDLAELKMRAVNSLESVMKDTKQVQARMVKLEGSIKGLAAEAKTQQKEHEHASRSTAVKGNSGSNKRTASRSIGPSIGSKLKDLQLEFSKLGKKKAECVARTHSLEVAKRAVQQELDCRDTCTSLKLSRGEYKEMKLVIPAEKVQRSRGRNGANFRRLANQFGVLVDEIEGPASSSEGASGSEEAALTVKIRGNKKGVSECYAELKHEVCEEIRYYRDLDLVQLQAMTFFSKYIEKEIEDRYNWVSCRLVVMFKEKQVLMKLANMSGEEKQVPGGRSDPKLRNVFDKLKRTISDRLNGYSSIPLTAKNQASVIIGKGGQNIEKLRAETGCFLYIENPSNASTRQPSPPASDGEEDGEAKYGSLRMIGRKRDLAPAKETVMKFVESQKRSTLVWRLDEEVDAEDLIECIWDRRTVKRDPTFGTVNKSPHYGLTGYRRRLRDAGFMLRVELEDGRFGTGRRQALHTGDPTKDAESSGHVELIFECYPGEFEGAKKVMFDMMDEWREYNFRCTISLRSEQSKQLLNLGRGGQGLQKFRNFARDKGVEIVIKRGTAGPSVESSTEEEDMDTTGNCPTMILSGLEASVLEVEQDWIDKLERFKRENKTSELTLSVEHLFAFGLADITPTDDSSGKYYTMVINCSPNSVEDGTRALFKHVRSIPGPEDGDNGPLSNTGSVDFTKDTDGTVTLHLRGTEQFLSRMKDAVSRLLESFRATSAVIGIPDEAVSAFGADSLELMSNKHYVSVKNVKSPYEDDDYNYYIVLQAESKDGDIAACRDEVSRIIASPNQASAGPELGAGPRAESPTVSEGTVAPVATPDVQRANAAAAAAVAAEQMRRSSQVMQQMSAPQVAQQQQYANAAAAANQAMWQQQQQQHQQSAQLQRQHSAQQQQQQYQQYYYQQQQQQMAAANAHMQQQQHQAAAAAAAAAVQQNAMFQQQQQAGLIWYYIDDVGNIQGPFNKAELAGWYCNRWLSEQLMVCKSLSWPNPQTSHFAPLRDFLHEILN